ncbi:related to dehydrogenases with different specificities (related to short-chain alcohol dehydrogenases) [Phialocephala subalpina]|uniref:Related to dehydrogenases with different specificities (Related to short-chain alcohol dehydrogenases) n=1 Tax=Phialocephala subalpina TaxID=576137 RepID=A0A1L7WWM1_9HELO|nr:related to dehydrogenases with different specificities (related to short-chain alcohol dehydrogenases) [Phialocephala subalpina]
MMEAVENDREAHSQLETNFFGPLRLIRSAPPLLRSQKSGTIVNITSVAGIDGLPTSGLYAASKFALEGPSESLQREVSPFGVRVLLFEPGAFRTRFLAGGSMVRPKEMEPAYKGTAVEATLAKFKEMDGKQRGDANKAVSIIFGVVMGDGVAKGLDKGLLRLPLGEDCVQRYETKVKGMEKNLEAVKKFVLGLDVDE